MSELRLIEPVVRFCAVISRHGDAHEWARRRIAETWGDVREIVGPVVFPANFYRDTMGDDLTKTLIAIDEFADPGELADWKTLTNEWESEYASVSNKIESRPLNIDPGYVTQAKLVLATIKDRDHRLYLRRGIFAEVTLNYMGGRWVHHRWTYPDYRTDEVADFAMRCRVRLRAHLQTTGQFRRG